MAAEGTYTEKYIPISNDVFNIVDRLKEIDPHYFVLRNRKTGRFEVHHSAQQGDTLALTLPYERLDGRTILLVQQSRAERARQYIAEMDRQNEQIEKQRDKALLQALQEKTEEEFRR